MYSPPISDRYYSDDYFDDFKEENDSDGSSVDWDGEADEADDGAERRDLVTPKLDKSRAETDLSTLVEKEVDPGRRQRPSTNSSLPESRDGPLRERRSFISLPEKIRRVQNTAAKADWKIDEVKSSEETDEPAKDKYSTVSLRRGRTEKFEIPSFYVLDRERRQSGRGYKRVNLFTLPSEADSPRSETRTHHLGQGDSPWILIMDGSEESDAEDDGACVEDAGLHVSEESGAQCPHTDLHPQATRPPSTTQANSNSRKESGVGCVGEGKISSFFSRLRRSPSSVAPPRPNNNGKESYNSIVSQQETQTPSKKSKMCQIL